MKQFLFIIAAIGITSAIIVVTTSSIIKTAALNTNQNKKGFAVMELFTSQGCSSCPPADDILGKYAEENDPHIIPIAFHVDYWNRLGWKDPFSSSIYSQRQKDYAGKLGVSDIYTPQLIINGEKEMVGSDEEKIKATIINALNEKPSISINNESDIIAAGLIKSTYTVAGSLSNTTLIALLVQHKKITTVKAGENNGATLANYNIVRAYTSTIAKQYGNSSLSLPTDCNKVELSLILLAQNNNTGKITGAFKKSL
jgi:hypothetical protein